MHKRALTHDCSVFMFFNYVGSILEQEEFCLMATFCLGNTYMYPSVPLMADGAWSLSGWMENMKCWLAVLQIFVLCCDWLFPPKYMPKHKIPITKEYLVDDDKVCSTHMEWGSRKKISLYVEIDPPFPPHTHTPKNKRKRKTTRYPKRNNERKTIFVFHIYCICISYSILANPCGKFG